MTSIDKALSEVRARGLRLSILQQCGDGLWQASLRDEHVDFLPARAMTAVEALTAALQNVDDGKTLASSIAQPKRRRASSNIFE